MQNFEENIVEVLEIVCSMSFKVSFSVLLLYVEVDHQKF